MAPRATCGHFGLEDGPTILMFNDVGPTSQPLLSNYACRVAKRGRQLICSCQGWVVTVLLVVGALVGLAAALSFVLFVQAGAPLWRGLIGSAMGMFIAGMLSQYALTRYQRHGRFVVDGEQGIVRRYRGGRVVEHQFRDISRVWLVWDYTDSRSMRSPPWWLQIRLSNGDIYRLAKGTRQELRPVCDAFRRLGLAPRAV